MRLNLSAPPALSPEQAEASRPAPRERVVLVPCSASTSRQWTALVEQLDEYDGLPIDLCGHGIRARWHGAGPLSLTEEAAAIAEAAVEGGQFHLVGHSYGGAVALHYARLFPERLASLTLVEPSAFHVLKGLRGEDGRLLDEIRGLAATVTAAVVAGDYCSAMARFIDYWGGAGSWDSVAESRQVQFAQLAVHVAHHFHGLIEEKATLADYAAIAAPTLIVSGTRSPAPSRAITRLLAEAMPRARHRTVRDAGHLSPITHPGEVNALVAAHVRTHRASPGLAAPRPGPICADAA